MKKQNLLLGAGLGLILALGACDDNEEALPPIETTDIDTEPAAMDSDWTPAGGELSAEQQERRAAADMTATEEEYRGYREQMDKGDSRSMGADHAMESDMDGADQGGDMEAESHTDMTMPPRSEMDFEWLDRNDDGRLSVAEYAIWAIPMNPAETKLNDEKRPYATPEQLNTAADSFFYYDKDGDTYLDRQEFQAAGPR